MIAGHKKQWNFLCSLKKNNSVPHAFLFTGEEKLGKKFLALNFSMFLNCQNKEDLGIDKYNLFSCGTCNFCKNMKNELNPDFFTIDNKREEIKITQIRELIKKLSFKSSEGGYKIGIIDNAHLMTRDAQNCFLKTLEEAKERTVIFLITQYPQLLLKTVISRLFRIKFFPVEREEIKKSLNKEGLNNEKSNELSRISYGHPGIAFLFSRNPEKEREWRESILEFEKNLFSSFSCRLQYAKKVAEKNNIEEDFENWINYFRQIFFTSLSSESALQARKNIERIFSAKITSMTTNVNKKLLLENLLINFN